MLCQGPLVFLSVKNKYCQAGRLLILKMTSMLVGFDWPRDVINDLFISQFQQQFSFTFRCMVFLLDCVNPEIVGVEIRRQKMNWEELSRDSVLKSFGARISESLIYHRAAQRLISIPAGGHALTL